MAFQNKIDPNELPSATTLENNLKWAEEKVDAVGSVLHELEYWVFRSAAYGRDAKLERKLIDELHDFYNAAKYELCDAQSSFHGFPEVFHENHRHGSYYLDLAKRLAYEQAENFKK